MNYCRRSLFQRGRIYRRVPRASKIATIGCNFRADATRRPPDRENCGVGSRSDKNSNQWLEKLACGLFHPTRTEKCNHWLHKSSQQDWEHERVNGAVAHRPRAAEKLQSLIGEIGPTPWCRV
jgi:hypothetical protein